MELIVAEKAIAGQRIASILAGKEVSSFIQQGANSFVVSSEKLTVPLRGHVMDVEFPKEYNYWLGTDLRKLVDAPIEYIETEKPILAFLRSIASKVSVLVVATDADREGESIGLEAIRAVQSRNPKVEVRRAYFSAITDKDIKEAFARLKGFDYAFADSADVRREIDLIWGAVLTRFLSIVSGRMGKEFLSAGRVQMPTLAIVVHREKERLAFVSKPYWELAAEFEKDGEKFFAGHRKGRFWSKEEAEKAFKCKEPPIGIVIAVSKKERVIAKPLPFNTTEFLRAATAIGFSAGKAMQVAESLYQAGYISYPRTDNTVYSKNLDLKEILSSLSKASEFSQIVEKILAQKQIVPSAGKETKDHPPIHPVSFVARDKLSEQSWKVYELVCRRFFATLYEDALVENLLVDIDLNKEPFVARGQSFLRKGWKEFYPYSQTEEVFLPSLKKGDEVVLKKLDLLSKQTVPPGRYSQGSLIKLMEENGLGTKATRHEIIQKLFARKYIFGQQSIEPNKIAFAVVDALEKHAGSVVKPKMTAELEQEMDLVAAGKKSKQDVVLESRAFLKEILGQLLEHKDDVGKELRQASRTDSIIGKCTRQECEGQLLVRHGKTGKRFVGCSAYPKCTNSFPLPQKGTISFTGRSCEKCGEYIIRVKGRMKPFEICLNMNCETKRDWRARQEAKANAAQSVSVQSLVQEKPKPEKKTVRAKKKNPAKEQNA